MKVTTHRIWMYNKFHPVRKAYTFEFLKDVEDFIQVACLQDKYLNEGVIRCSCKLCNHVRITYIRYSS